MKPLIPDNRDDELKQVLAELQIDPDTAREITADIQAGDRLLDACPEPEFPLVLQERISQALTDNPAQRHPIRRYHHLRALVALAAVVLMAFAVLFLQDSMFSGSELGNSGSGNINSTGSGGEVASGAHADIFFDEIVLWKVTYIQEVDNSKIDDFALSEISSLWKETKSKRNSDIEKNNTLRKEKSYENYA